MKIDPKKLYSAREAADFLKVNEETVKNYCRSKQLIGKQIGPKKKWYVSGAAILKREKEWGQDEI
jgi:hypothetical protein